MVFFVLFGCFYQEVVRWTKLARGLEGQSDLDSKRSLTVDVYTLGFTKTRRLLSVNFTFTTIRNNAELNCLSYWQTSVLQYSLDACTRMRDPLLAAKTVLRQFQALLSLHAMQYPSCRCHYCTINLICSQPNLADWCYLWLLIFICLVQMTCAPKPITVLPITLGYVRDRCSIDVSRVGLLL